MACPSHQPLISGFALPVNDLQLLPSCGSCPGVKPPSTESSGSEGTSAAVRVLLDDERGRCKEDLVSDDGERRRKKVKKGQSGFGFRRCQNSNHRQKLRFREGCGLM